MNQQRVTRIVTVQGLAPIAPATTPAAGLRVDWPITGTVMWLMGSVSGATDENNYMAGISGLGFRIQIRGITEFVTTGVGASYMQFSTAFPTAGFRFPVSIPVQQTDAWFVFIRNTNAAATFTPDFAFGVAE